MSCKSFSSSLMVVFVPISGSTAAALIYILCIAVISRHSILYSLLFWDFLWLLLFYLWIYYLSWVHVALLLLLALRPVAIAGLIGAWVVSLLLVLSKSNVLRFQSLYFLALIVGIRGLLNMSCLAVGSLCVRCAAAGSSLRCIFWRLVLAFLFLLEVLSLLVLLRIVTWV